MSKHIVRVSNGKYTFVIDAAPTVTILRHGERWYEMAAAFNALHSMMCELDAARVVVVAAVRRFVDRASANDEPIPSGLVSALARHSSLVSDREEPSEWCGPMPWKEPF